MCLKLLSAKRVMSLESTVPSIGKFCGGSPFLEPAQMIVGVSTETWGRWNTEASSSTLKVYPPERERRRKSSKTERSATRSVAAKPLMLEALNCLKAPTRFKTLDLAV